MNESVLAADHETHTGNDRGVVPVSVITAASQSAPQAQARPLAVGIDSLYLSYFIEAEGIDFEELRYQKEMLFATPGLEFVEFELGGERFALRRGARKPYSFRLSNRTFIVLLSEHVTPRLHLQITSEALWCEGLDAVLARFEQLLQRQGVLRSRATMVSRVDAAFDFASDGTPFVLDNFVSLTRKDNMWRDKRAPQSFQFGKGDVVCRVYDKIAEIREQSAKVWLFDIWGVCENVWRVEFQVRGQALKDANIGTIDQMRAFLPDLVRNLARQHTSLRSPTNDTNRSRWPLHPLWQTVVDCAGHLLTAPKEGVYPFVTGVEYRLDQRLRSLLGDLKSIAALLSLNRSDEPLGLRDLMWELLTLLARFHSPELWTADVRAKIAALELGL